MRNPNTTLWHSYQANSVMRGRLVAQILAERMGLENAQVLDVGCGDGGIAIALAQAGAQVKAIDPDPARLQKLAEYKEHAIEMEIIGAEMLHEADLYYDAIILNDVLEHTKNPDTILGLCRNCLKKGGLLYITSPNKYSLLNLLCDPHYSLPGVSLLSRRSVKQIVAHGLKWLPPEKQDFAQLLTLPQMLNLLLRHKLAWEFVNRRAAQIAFAEPLSLWSRKSHLFLIKLIKWFKLEKFFITFINDKFGFFNKFINPTWFILAKR